MKRWRKKNSFQMSVHRLFKADDLFWYSFGAIFGFDSFTTGPHLCKYAARFWWHSKRVTCATCEMQRGLNESRPLRPFSQDDYCFNFGGWNSAPKSWSVVCLLRTLDKPAARSRRCVRLVRTGPFRTFREPIKKLLHHPFPWKRTLR